MSTPDLRMTRDELRTVATSVWRIESRLRLVRERMAKLLEWEENGRVGRQPGHQRGPRAYVDDVLAVDDACEQWMLTTAVILRSNGIFLLAHDELIERIETAQLSAETS